MDIWNRYLIQETLLLIAQNILKLTTCTKCTLLSLSEKAYQTNWLINLTYYGISYILPFLRPPWRLIWPWSTTRWKKLLRINREVTSMLFHRLNKLSAYPWKNSLHQNFPRRQRPRGREGGCDIAAIDWVSSLSLVYLSPRHRIILSSNIYIISGEEKQVSSFLWVSG